MKESEVLEKFELFKNGLIKKNARIEELEIEVNNLNPSKNTRVLIGIKMGDILENKTRLLENSFRQTNA